MRRLLPLLAVMVTASYSGRAEAEESSLRLRVEPTDRREVVTLVFVNEGATRAQLYLDGRLTTVELLSESARRLGRCAAPRGAAVSGADDRRFVSLAPGEVAEELLDVRYLCFGARLRRLAEATRIRVTYRARTSYDPMGRPLVSSQLGPAEHELASGPAAAGASEAEAPLEAPPFTLRRVGAHPDAPDGGRVPIRLELSAPPRARLPVVVRPELFAFSVTRLRGEPLDCRLPESRIRPLRDFFERLGRRRITLDLARLCPEGEIDRAGVYEVTPSFSTGHDGSDVGLQAWTGTVEGEPFLVRVRRASRQQGEPVEIEAPMGRATPEGNDGDAR